MVRNILMSVKIILQSNFMEILIQGHFFHGIWWEQILEIIYGE